MKGSTAITTIQPFGRTDSGPLFSVNFGVPIADALEQAMNLMACVEALTAADALPNKDLQATALQHLAETAKAIVEACHPGASEPSP